MVRESFLEKVDFQPDDFQVEAFDLVDAGKNVLVAAPTGSGKTLVANYGIEKALAAGGRVFYTTPIKALSNQKFHDLAALYGVQTVGLLTGDISINPHAPVIVMTTEVLRNMIYVGDPLTDLHIVVLDEVHYLQDACRGAVWEEVIIHLPLHIQLLCLSATVSNADELTEWLETVRGPSGLVVETKRPVDLDNFYMIGERNSNHLHMIKTVRGTRPNADGFSYDPDVGQRYRQKGKRGARKKSQQRRKWKTPRRLDILLLLNQKKMLPAIYFIFSRNACDDAAFSLAESGIQLTSTYERDQIRKIVSEKSSLLSADDLELLEFDKFKMALEAGVAPHHAGMVPPFKEIVESCFIKGFLKVVFATETLALGINMPARTVVIDKLTKFTGETHEFLTAAQFTQLTGRAGRRGIDKRGRAVVLWSPFVSFKQVSDLALSKEFVLTSSFRPNYNMSANLVKSHDQQEARHLLNLSFAQFRADATVVRSEQSLERLRSRRQKLINRLEKEYGSIEELKAAFSPKKSVSTEDIFFALSQLVPGEVCLLDGPNLPSLALAIATFSRKGGKIKAKFVDLNGESFALSPSDLTSMPTAVAQVTLPEPYLPNSVTFAQKSAERMAKLKVAQKHLHEDLSRKYAPLSQQARKGLQRLKKLEKEIERSERFANRHAASLGVQFDRVVDLLEERNHLYNWSLTETGEKLVSLYHESDLLIVEAITQGIFDDLNPAELAAMASVFCYEERRQDFTKEVWFPAPLLRQKFMQAENIFASLSKAETKRGISPTRKPDAGFLSIAHAWAAGGALDDVLDGEQIRPGDFIRTTKQQVDLLRQLVMLVPNSVTSETAKKAVKAVFRDLVESSSMVDSQTIDEVVVEEPGVPSGDEGSDDNQKR